MEEARVSQLVDGPSINVGGQLRVASSLQDTPRGNIMDAKKSIGAIMTIFRGGWLAASVLAAMLWTATLFALIQRSGARNTSIEISN